MSQLRSPIRPFAAFTAALSAAAFLFPAATYGQVIFNSIANPLPPHMVTQPFQAQQVSEFGTGIVFSAGTPRSALTVTVILDSYGCVTGQWNYDPMVPPTACATAPGSTFSHPVTLNVYAVGPGSTVGALLFTKTQTFVMPYRPSADLLNCTTANAGKWFDSATATCNDGIAFPITFYTLGTPALPDQVIVTVAYNTSNFGPNPIGPAACGGNCPYDALNVGTLTSGPSVGSFPNAGTTVYLNSISLASYCLAGPVGVLRLDSGCWLGFQPQISVSTTPAGVFQIHYFSNLDRGDSYINLTNTGASSTSTGLATGEQQNGSLCTNIYTYSAEEQLISCCSCLVTPNALNSLSVKNDLLSNTLTPSISSSVVVKLVSTAGGASQSLCNPALIGTSAMPVAPGLAAWGATLHPVPVGLGMAITETPFVKGTFSVAEVTRMSQLCSFIRANGSGYGICKSCRSGGMGADKK